MTDQQSILLGAQQELERRYREADARGDWRERWYLSHLVDVADYMRRLSIHDATPHYRAEKSGDLAEAVDEVQKVALIGYAGWPEVEHEGAHPTAKAITEAFALLGQVRSATRTAAWLAAAGTGAELYESDAERIRRTARDFTAWAERIASTAVPDPDGL